jgi:integrase
MKRARRDGLRKICDHAPRTWGKDACLPCPWYANEQLNGVPVRVNLNRLFNKENVSRTEAKGLLGDLQGAMRHVLKDVVKPTTATPKEIAEWQAQWRRKLIASIAGSAEPAAAPAAPAGITLRDYAREWLAGCPLRVKATTVEFYTSSLHRYILPALGDRLLAEIERDDLSALVAKLDAHGLKRTSIRGVLRTLSALLTTAMASPKKTKITSNPALKTKDLIAQAGKPKDDPDPFSTEDSDLILAITQEHFPRWSGQKPARVRTDAWYAFLLCGLRTGMRLGELLGLEWGDVDWHARTITITRNFTHGKLTTPKNGKSRTVDLSTELAVVLRLFRRQLRAEFLLYGMPLPDPIFPTKEGERLDAANVRRVMRSICDKADLRRRSPHDLRHTFASQMLNLGAPITEVSQQLGHSSVAITLSTYARWLPRPDGRRSVDLLGRKTDKVAKNLQEKALPLAAAS